MSAFIQTVLPITAIMLAGYLCGISRLIQKTGSETINGFVYYFALPTLFILFLSDTDFKTIFNIKIIATFLGAQLIIMSILITTTKKIFKLHTNSETIVQSMASIFSNTGYLGIPLMIAAFGYAKADVAILTTIINGAITLPLTLCLLEAAKRTQSGTHPIKSFTQSIPAITKSLITNPLLIGAAIGMIMSIMELRSDGALRIFLQTSADAAPAAALFAMGLFLAAHTQFGYNPNSPHKSKSDLKSSSEILYVSLIKVIAHPLITYLIATFIMELDERNTAATVIMAALPTGGLVFLVAQKVRCYEHKSATTILLSTLLSIVTVSFLIEYYSPILLR